MNAEKLKRLMALMEKSADSLTDGEKTELANLKAEAVGAPDKAMTADDVKLLVAEAVKANTVTAEQVKAQVETAMKGLKLPEGIKADDIKSVVEAALKAQTSHGITQDDLKASLEAFTKSFRRDGKMTHSVEDDYAIELPISHRSGNLSVGHKQLLNIMLATKRGVTGEIDESVINKDIPESVLKSASQRGELAEKRLFTSLQTKGLSTSASGSGLEWMNVTLSSQLIARMYLASTLVQALAANEVVMPTATFQYPLRTTRPTFRLGAENTAPNGSTIGTGNLLLVAKKLIGMVDYSYEADEDAILAVLPQIISSLGDSGADALEDAIINGDTAGTHQDSDTQTVGVTHVAKAFDGIRKLALAQASLKLSLATGGISAANIGSMRKALARWGLNPRDLLIVAGVNGYNDLIQLPETLTADKVGSAARILTGVAPSLFGIDIVASARVREDLNAVGVYDGTTVTKGSIMVLHKPSWIQGVRKGFTIETDRDIKSQSNWVVASFRRDFKPIESLANTKAAVLGYNYTS